MYHDNMTFKMGCCMGGWGGGGGSIHIIGSRVLHLSLQRNVIVQSLEGVHESLPGVGDVTWAENRERGR